MITRLNDEQLNVFIESAIKNATRGMDACIKSQAYSNIALIEIQLRLLEKA